MTPPAPTPDDAEGRICQSVSDAAVRRLAEAVAHLANDSDYFLQALTDMLTAMRPISRERPTDNDVRFLIESDEFTAEAWAETSASVDRGYLQLGETQGWLLDLFATMSLENVRGFLGWDGKTVQTAVADGRLYAVDVSGRLRFPLWQFIVGDPNKLIPGLTDIIEVVTPRWDWHSVAGFMATPQSRLVVEGRKTPAQWLRDGGDVHDVIEIAEASDWR